MRFPRFVEAVSRRSELPVEQAATISRAVLQTLADRITGGESADLAAQLPDELSGYLTAPAEGGGGGGGPVTFLRRVADRAGVDPAVAEAGTVAVLATLREAVTVDEFQDLVAQLPKGFDAMVDPIPRPPYDR
ncbi:MULTISPECIES: DUF2267 domain-containing protein [Micromonospora]|uniref:DUF2267 domain-containing protein n=1 Tax=Micromonospora solifontis TaxID=2487138 RepID=A0ABX9WJA1_9ACTN|nr:MULTISPECIES: DUF2267 domain-containing protein [Micromonospora]NES15983.1 DUF2267 domain-containing protein [Micromonospora sp. PPF5-17B]NES36596.1 DUF2267 domain-containing protein [Micromonospora solifontis]NES57346.1 DUF2267 domain-containing protein [Micromonospora sp. PPF5-6]RNL99334.1 DUF2267 domain-containing protein [Micromonospora solifontis]